MRISSAISPAPSALTAAGIRCRRPVFRPLHETLGGSCPCADALHRAVVSLPLYPGLTDAEIASILGTVPALIRALQSAA